MQLQLAKLLYGAADVYDIKPSADLPIPMEFDFNKPEECAKLIFACMSNASGGFRLRNCKLRYNPKHLTANLTAIGVNVYYAVTDAPKLSVEETIAQHPHWVVVELGDVSTDQYGGGWERAEWMASEKPEVVV